MIKERSAHMQYENIIFTVKANIATIQINRPKYYNALNSDVNKEMFSALDEIEADGSIRVLVLTGNEKAFAAGADIGELADAGPGTARETCKTAALLNDRLESLAIPTIAAVNGLAWGGGGEMAIACDFRVGGANTSFRFPEVSFGIIPGANGTQRLLALTGTAKAREIVLLCRTIKGEEAYRLGLLTRLVDDGDVLTEAYNLAGELAAMPGKALAAAKRAIIEGTLGTMTDGKRTELFEVCMLFETSDQKEGMAAFMEKRKPEFTNS